MTKVPPPRTLLTPRLGFLAVAAFGLAVTVVAPAYALVSKAPNNNVAPADDPGWGRVGSVGGVNGNGSGVYLGNGWVITANHNNDKSQLNIDATSYIGTGLSTRLKNPDNTDSDVFLFQVTVPDGSPLAGVPVITLPTSAPGTSNNLVMIGTGLLPNGGEQTFSGSETGFLISSLRAKIWGDNNRFQLGFDGGMAVFNTSFDNNVALPNEAEIVDHDSGGGIFVKNLVSGIPTWQLAGLIYGILPSGFNSTNGYTAGSHADYGDESFAVDLSNPTYQSQIASLVPEPASAAMLGLVAAGALALRPRARKR